MKKIIVLTLLVAMAVSSFALNISINADDHIFWNVGMKSKDAIVELGYSDFIGDIQYNVIGSMNFPANSTMIVLGEVKIAWNNFLKIR